MSDSNKWAYNGTREEVLNMGYEAVQTVQSIKVYPM